MIKHGFNSMTQKAKSKPWLPRRSAGPINLKQKSQLKKSWRLFFGIKMKSFC